MHYPSRRCQALDERMAKDRAEREERTRARDRAYRAALRLEVGTRIPAQLGNVNGHSNLAPDVVEARRRQARHSLR